MNRLLLLSTLALAGCLSPGTSDPSTIWELDAPTQASAVRVNVKLPAELRRPTLVTRDGDHIVNHDLDRWASPLGDLLARAIASELAYQPILSVTIDFQRLDISMSGSGTAVIVAQVELDAGAGNPPILLTIKSEHAFGVGRACGEAKTPSHELSGAHACYSALPKLISDKIRDKVAEEQGGVAKPAPGVTVPGQ